MVIFITFDQKNSIFFLIEVFNDTVISIKGDHSNIKGDFHPCYHLRLLSDSGSLRNGRLSL